MSKKPKGMTKKEFFEKHLRETSSYDGAIYLTVDQYGNSYSRIYDTKEVPEQILLEKLDEHLEAWWKQRGIAERQKLYKVEVTEVLGISQISNGYNIAVRAKTEDRKQFTYIFVKNKKEDADAIKEGYKWEMGCKPIAF